MRRCALLTLLVLAGCGGESAPSSVVPADSTIYVGMEADRAERLLQSTSREDVDFDRDVRPWLGSRAAYFTDGSADTYGLVFTSEDDDAAEAFARKVTAAGPLRAAAVIDGHLVVTSSRELLRAANAAAGGQALADSARLDVDGEAGEDGPEVVLATVEPEAFVTGLELYVDLPDELPDLDLGEGPFTARRWPGRLEVSGLRPAGETPSLAGLPATAELVVGAASGAEIAEWAAARRFAPLLEHLGATTLVVELGARRIAGAVVDEAALRARLKTFARPAGVAIELADGQLVITSGTLLGDEELGETARYREAEQRLGGPPTLMTGDFAARLDERGVLRIAG